MDQKGKKATLSKLNNSLLFSTSVSLFPFLFSRRDGGGEMLGDRVGGCRLHRSEHQVYSPTVVTPFFLEK
jgi:hypothetical protein